MILQKYFQLIRWKYVDRSNHCQVLIGEGLFTPEKNNNIKNKVVKGISDVYVQRFRFFFHFGINWYRKSAQLF